MTTLKPLSDKVIIKPLEKDEVTKAGIVLPDSAKEEPQEGEVIAVGEGKYENGKLIPTGVKKGDKVLFAKYGGDEVKINGEEYKIISASDILAIVK